MSVKSKSKKEGKQMAKTFFERKLRDTKNNCASGVAGASENSVNIKHESHIDETGRDNRSPHRSFSPSHEPLVNKTGSDSDKLGQEEKKWCADSDEEIKSGASGKATDERRKDDAEAVVRRVDEVRQGVGEDKPETDAKPKVYSDDDVCALLGIRKRVLVKMRTQKMRGVDWDVEGMQVGMTKAWITKYRKDADTGRIEPIRPKNGIVTVEKTGPCMNNKTIIGKRVCDGKTVIVRVMDARMINTGDQFNAIWEREMLAYAQNINRARY